tara:strand:- start:985 stop:1557 length:573 start_codon:yes stop_codon:yes gene_type:complete
MKSYRDKNGFEVRPGEDWDDKKSDETLKYMTDPNRKIGSKPKAKEPYDPLRIMLIEEMKVRDLDSNEIRYLMDTKDRSEIPQATPEQVGKLAERLERNRQITGAAPTKLKNLEARFKKPKPFTKVKKAAAIPFEIPKVEVHRPEPIVRTPEEIAAENNFNQMLREHKENKFKDLNSGLGGLINPGGKRYV